VPEIQELLTQLSKTDASDLHLCAGSPPCFRLNGRIEPVEAGAKSLDARELEQMLYRVLTNDQQARLQNDRELDFSIGFTDVGRFRGNVHRQRGSWAAVFRKIPLEIPSLLELGLPEDGGPTAPLAVDVAAEAPDIGEPDGEIQFPVVLQSRLLVVCEHAVKHLLQFPGVQRLRPRLHGLDAPVQAETGRRTRAEVQVRGVCF
jgi:hypothetical protein